MENNNYINQWRSADYLVTGDETHIAHLLKPFLDSRNDPYDALSHRVRNLWVPHNYLTEFRRLTAKVMASMYFSGVTQDTDIYHQSSFYEFFQSLFQSSLNYGGACVVVTPPNKKSPTYIANGVPGKHIVDTVFNKDLNSFELFSWIDHQSILSFETGSIEKKVVQHVFFVKNRTVYYYSVIHENQYNSIFGGYANPTLSSYDFSLGVITSFDKIPVVGIDISNSDTLSFKGSPYLFPLIASCIRSAFAAAKIDYLIEFVLPPIIVHRGARMSSIENADWRGINIGNTDSVDYLTYDGPILEAGEAQLERYSTDIRNQIPVNFYHSNTALEARLTDENSNMIKSFVANRFAKFCFKSAQMLNKYSLIENINISQFNVVYKETVYNDNDNTSQPNNDDSQLDSRTYAG
jgi:hypothetical protein